MLGAFKTMAKFQQLAIIGAVLLSLFLGFQAWLAYHDYQNNRKVLNDISEQTRQLQSEDEKRVNDASAVVGAMRDCIKLGLVYNTGESECRQDSLEDDFYKAPFAKKADIARAGQVDPVVGGLPLPMGGVLQDSAKDESMPSEQGCYPEKVSDDYGLPVWELDVDGLLVRKVIEVCP